MLFCGSPRTWVSFLDILLLHCFDSIDSFNFYKYHVSFNRHFGHISHLIFDSSSMVFGPILCVGVERGCLDRCVDILGEI